jgi:hypothetical protein
MAITGHSSPTVGNLTCTMTVSWLEAAKIWIWTSDEVAGRWKAHWYRCPKDPGLLEVQLQLVSIEAN